MKRGICCNGEQVTLTVRSRLGVWCKLFLDLADTSSFKGSQDELTTTIMPVIVEEEEERFLATFLPCDPRRWMHRFLMLILMCFLSFGSYYVYDNPAALQKTIMNVSKAFAVGGGLPSYIWTVYTAS